LRGLLPALLAAAPEHHWTLVVDRDAENLPAAEIIRIDARRTVLNLIRSGRALSDPRFDVVLFPTLYSYVPIFCRARKIVVIHDVTAELYPELTLHPGLGRWLWRLKSALARWQAHALGTVSEHSRRGIKQIFGASTEVIGEAPDPIFRPMDLPVSRTIAYVGGFAPLKNVPRLLDAFAQIAAQPRFADVNLLLVGEDRDEAFRWDVEALRRQAAPLGVRVRFTGFYADEALAQLLNRAWVLALPS